MNEVTGNCSVLVSKADIPMKPDESFDEFMQRLQKAIIGQINTMKLPHKVRDVWVTELKDKTLVAEFGWALKDPEDITQTVDRERWGTYQAAWEASGSDIKFSNWMQVERKTIWIPKTKIEKRAPGSLWGGLPLKV